MAPNMSLGAQEPRLSRITARQHAGLWVIVSGSAEQAHKSHHLVLVLPGKRRALHPSIRLAPTCKGLVPSGQWRPSEVKSSGILDAPAGGHVQLKAHRLQSENDQPDA